MVDDPVRHSVVRDESDDLNRGAAPGTAHRFDFVNFADHGRPALGRDALVVRAIALDAVRPRGVARGGRGNEERIPGPRGSGIPAPGRGRAARRPGGGFSSRRFKLSYILNLLKKKLISNSVPKLRLKISNILKLKGCFLFICSRRIYTWIRYL